MDISKFYRGTNGLFGGQHLRLVYQQDELSKFIQEPFSYENVFAQIKRKEAEYTVDSRNTLVKVLRKQYSTISSEKVEGQIDLLEQKNTFTVTTGHQLSLFTGPLYFILKILETVKLSRELKKAYPEYNFVPIYWMATEDHDFEEIQSVNVFNKEIKWDTDQVGAVGRFHLDGFEEVKSAFLSFFDNHPESEIFELFKKYSGDNLASATRSFVHALFEEFELLILDGDDADLKSSMTEVFQREIEENFSFHEVNATNAELEKIHAKIQVHAREINLFYIGDGERKRIIKNDSGTYSLSDEREVSQAELLTLIQKSPKDFSPNVVLRPLYQEMVLPNLVYTGGGGEIGYWLQLKGVFDAVNVPFPIIKVRNSVFYLDENTLTKMTKLGLELEDFLKDTDQLKKEYVLENAGDELEFDDLDETLTQLTEKMVQHTLSVDENMKSFAEAEITRLTKQIEQFKSKLVKREKSKFEKDLKAIDAVKGKLFPRGVLQERTVNFFAICPDGNYAHRLQELFSALNPREKDVVVVNAVSS